MVNQTEILEDLFITRRDGLVSSIGSIGSNDPLGTQLKVLERFESEGYKLGGWKIGMTSGNAKDMMGKGYRPFGFILSDRIFDSGSIIPVPASNIMNCQVEPELCLIIGESLQGDQVSIAEAKAAVRAVVPAFEINEIRKSPEDLQALMSGAPSPEQISLLQADGLAHWGIALGPEAPVTDRLVDTTVELYHNDELVETETPGDTMDDPFLSLTRLCALLSKYGRGLEAGQAIITGAFFHYSVKGPSSYRADFKGIGEVSLDFL